MDYSVTDSAIFGDCVSCSIGLLLRTVAIGEVLNYQDAWASSKLCLRPAPHETWLLTMNYLLP